MLTRLTLLAPVMLMLLGASSVPSPGPVTLHIVEVDSTSVGYAWVGESEGLESLGPMTEWPDGESTTGGPTQEIETEWYSGGKLIRVRTKLGSGTDAEELAISRHARLVRRMELEFKRDPTPP